MNADSPPPVDLGYPAAEVPQPSVIAAMRVADHARWERAIRAAMKQAGGDTKEAAELLGITQRTLSRWIKDERALADLYQAPPEWHRIRHAAGGERADHGALLRAARDRAGLSQAALGAKVGAGQSSVAETEAGTRLVTSDYVVRVLKACGLPRSWRPAR